MRGNRNVGGCPSAGGVGETKSPQERYDLIFLKHFYRAQIFFNFPRRYGYQVCQVRFIQPGSHKSLNTAVAVLPYRQSQVIFPAPPSPIRSSGRDHSNGVKEYLSRFLSGFPGNQKSAWPYTYSIYTDRGSSRGSCTVYDPPQA